MTDPVIKLTPHIVQAIKNNCATLLCDWDEDYCLGMLQAMQQKKNAYQWLSECDDKTLKKLELLPVPDGENESTKLYAYFGIWLGEDTETTVKKMQYNYDQLQALITFEKLNRLCLEILGERFMVPLNEGFNYRELNVTIEADPMKDKEKSLLFLEELNKDAALRTMFMNIMSEIGNNDA